MPSIIAVNNKITGINQEYLSKILKLSKKNIFSFSIPKMALYESRVSMFSKKYLMS